MTSDFWRLAVPRGRHAHGACALPLVRNERAPCAPHAKSALRVRAQRRDARTGHGPRATCVEVVRGEPRGDGLERFRAWMARTYLAFGEGPCRPPLCRPPLFPCQVVDKQQESLAQLSNAESSRSLDISRRSA